MLLLSLPTTGIMGTYRGLTHPDCWPIHFYLGFAVHRSLWSRHTNLDFADQVHNGQRRRVVWVSSVNRTKDEQSGHSQNYTWVLFMFAVFEMSQKCHYFFYLVLFINFTFSVCDLKYNRLQSCFQLKLSTWATC